MRPILKPALVRVWRDATTLQLGLPPGRTAVIGGAGSAVVAFLDLLDGSHRREDLLSSGTPHGLARDAAKGLLDDLVRLDLVDDDTLAAEPLTRMTGMERDRLVRDMRAWSSTTSTEGARGVLARRRRAWVDIQSSGRLGISIAQLVAAAGVGRITVTDPTVVTAGMLAPLAGHIDDLGQAGSRVAYARLAAQAPSVHRIAAARRRPDITVVAPDEAVVDVDLADDLMRRSAVHLPIVQRSGAFVIGPLVIPGTSACIRCVELIETDQDPAWPLILAQLRTPTRRQRDAMAAHDTVLGTAAASLSCLQITTWLDQRIRPSLVDAVSQLTLPEGRQERREVMVHPACGCAWAGGTDVPNAAPSRRPRTMAG